MISRVFLDKEDTDNFKLALKEALEYSLNINSNQSAEFMAKYLDMHLKKSPLSNSLESEQELRHVIEEVIKIFRYVKSKDVFEEFYARSLSRRLLLKKSANRDAEQLMITELRAECGDQFTKKVEEMLKDLNVSNQFMQEYKMVKGINDETIMTKQEGIETHFNVLSQASWPISAQQEKEVIIPPLLLSFQKDFEAYYTGKYKGKCLQWNIQMGTCLIQANFSSNQVKLLDMSCSQALVLLAFNDPNAD